MAIRVRDTEAVHHKQKVVWFEYVHLNMNSSPVTVYLTLHLNLLNSFEEIVWDKQGPRGQRIKEEVAGRAIREGETGFVSACAMMLSKWDVLFYLKWIVYGALLLCLISDLCRNQKESEVENKPAQLQTDLERIVEETTTDPAITEKKGETLLLRF